MLLGESCCRIARPGLMVAESGVVVVVDQNGSFRIQEKSGKSKRYQARHVLRQISLPVSGIPMTGALACVLDVIANLVIHLY